MTKRRAMEGGGGGGGGSEFFICFTSRTSSSTTSAGGGGGGSGGVRVPSSKSLMSPGRNSGTGPSLSSSLSRRLRNSGSVKGGGQSPMFPNSSAAISVKKKGNGFEAVEPSSPKVTCIGQVRVKTKKKKKNAAALAAANANMNMMTRSASVSASRREASFRRSRSSSAHGGRGGGGGACLPGSSSGRNQKWVHQLPITICETLRAFGSDFSCLLPSSCAGGGGGGGGRSRGGCYSFSDGGDKVHKRERSTTATTDTATTASSTSSSSSSSSCGAVLLRWLMAIQESEEDKGREVMRLMVEETGKGEVGFLLRDKTDFDRKLQHQEDREEDDDDLMVKEENEKAMAAGGEEEEEDDVEKGRVSVCIPPKNALLLMRCRSDPVRMAALANKFWGSPVLKIQCDGEEEEKVSSKLETDKDVHNYHVNEKKQAAEEEKDKEKKTNLQAEQVLLNPGEVEKKVAVEAVIDVKEEERLEGVVLNGPNAEEGMLSHTEYGKGSGEMDEKERTVSKEEEKEMLQGKQVVLSEPSKKEDGEVVDEEETMEACDKELQDEEAHSVQRQTEEEGNIKGGGRRSISNSSSNKGKGGENPKTREVAKRRSCYSSSSKEKKERRRHSFSIERESRRNSFSSEREARRSSFSVDREGRRRWSFSLDKEELQVPKQHPMLTSSDDVEKQQKVDMPSTETEEEAMEEIVTPPKVTLGSQKMALTLEARNVEVVAEKEEMKKKGEQVQIQGGEKKRRDLPECLLLMMYEPKLSMEVSKETWVCSTDFLRWRPNQNPQPQPNQQSSKADDAEGNADKAKCSESNKEAIPVTPDSAAIDPPPRPPPATSPIVSAGGCGGAVVLPQAAPYAPFVLTRCKSEPLKSSARLAPESCFWKSRHQPIGATGIGF